MLNPLAKVQNLKDPLKMFVSTWQIVFKPGSPLTSLVRTDNLELRCQTFGFPKLTGDKTVVQWGGFERRYAGKQIKTVLFRFWKLIQPMLTFHLLTRMFMIRNRKV